MIAAAQGSRATIYIAGGKSIAAEAVATRGRRADIAIEARGATAHSHVLLSLPVVCHLSMRHVVHAAWVLWSGRQTHTRGRDFGMYVADITQLQDAREWERILQQDHAKYLDLWGPNAAYTQQLAMDLEDIRGRIAELSA